MVASDIRPGRAGRSGRRSPLLLDVSRTVARARLPAPTGIDRVERAWIDRALGGEARFLCRIGGRQHLLEPGSVASLVRWLDGEGPAPARDLRALNPLRDERLGRAQALVRREAAGSAPADAPAAIAAMLGCAAQGAYLNPGHDNLTPALMEGVRTAGLARLVLIHDVIPLEHPEFVRPQTPARFRTMLETAARADLIICNSADTRDRLRRAADPLPPLVVAPLGVDAPRPAPPDPAGGFLCLGTIEPRKNHALLLDVWARLWRERGEAAPALHMVGRRGWRNEAVLRALDARPPAVLERGPLPDDRAAALMAGARALLFPSFAEGFGLPLAEALARGVPVIASDLPALREVGGDAPDWLSPDDPAAWLAAVRDYAADPSPRRDAQLARIGRWRAPGWEAHFRTVENAIETILAQAGDRG